MSIYMNCFSDRQDSRYGLTWHKESDIKLPAPIKAFVFVDEHENSIFDAVFVNQTPGITILPNATLWAWVDFPATRHNNGANITFADGHADRWGWREPNTIQLGSQSPWLIFQGAQGLNDRDLRRFIKATKPVNPVMWNLIVDD